MECVNISGKKAPVLKRLSEFDPGDVVASGRWGLCMVTAQHISHIRGLVNLTDGRICDQNDNDLFCRVDATLEYDGSVFGFIQSK